MLLSVAYNHNIYTYMHTYKQKMHLWSPMSKHTQEATMSSGNSGIFLRALCFLETADIQDRLMWLSWWDCCKDGARPNFYVVLPFHLVHYPQRTVQDVSWCISQKVWCTWYTLWNWTWIQYQILYNSFWNTTWLERWFTMKWSPFFQGNISGGGRGGTVQYVFDHWPISPPPAGGSTTSFMESGSNSSSDFSWAFSESQPKRNETKHPNMGIRRNLISAIQTEVSIHFCCAW